MFSSYLRVRRRFSPKILTERTAHRDKTFFLFFNFLASQKKASKSRNLAFFPKKQAVFCFGDVTSGRMRSLPVCPLVPSPHTGLNAIDLNVTCPCVFASVVGKCLRVRLRVCAFSCPNHKVIQQCCNFFLDIFKSFHSKGWPAKPLSD